MGQSKRDLVFIVLAGIFITNAITAELIGAKIIALGPFILSVGILPWPIVFLTTDIINEYFGKAGVRRLSLITAGLISFAFLIVWAAMNVPAAAYPEISAVSDEQFTIVFGQSLLIIIGSIVAFLISQLVDVMVFWLVREKTGGKMIWLRATGSTAVSQLVDSFVVGGIAFWLPGKWTTEIFIKASLSGYSFKLMIALLLTPLIYLGHGLVKKYLGKEEAGLMAKKSAEETLHHSVKD